MPVKEFNEMRALPKVEGVSGACLGLALPLMVLGNIPTYLFLIAGLITGYLAPKPLTPVARGRAIACNTDMIALALLLAWLGVCSIFGLNRLYALNHWIVVVGMALAGIGLFQVFCKLGEPGRRLFLRWMSEGVVAGFIIAALILILEPWLMHIGLYTPEEKWTQTKLRFYSSVLAVVLPFCWLHWMRRDGGWRLDARAMGWIGLSIIMTFMCAGRAGWLGLGASGCVLGLMMLRYHHLKVDWRALAIGLAGVAAVCITGYLLVFGVSSLEERMGVVVPARGLGGGRLEIWRMAWDGFVTNPLMGIGVNDFRFLPGADAHPHNFILQLAVEGGVFTLALALVLMGRLAARWWPLGRKNPLVLACFCAMLGFVICGLTNKSIFNPEWLVYPVVIVAFGCSLTVAPEAPPVTSRVRRSGKRRVSS